MEPVDVCYANRPGYFFIYAVQRVKKVVELEGCLFYLGFFFVIFGEE